MQVAAGVVDPVAPAQGVEAVALPGMQLPSERQRVEHAPLARHRAADRRQACQLSVEETDVEGRVVDHELGILDELEELASHVREARLRGEELVGDAVHGERAGVHFAIRAEVAMEAAPGHAPVAHLDAADLDDAVALRDLEAGGFGVEDDLAHGRGV